MSDDELKDLDLGEEDDGIIHGGKKSADILGDDEEEIIDEDLLDEELDETLDEGEEPLEDNYGEDDIWDGGFGGQSDEEL